jgi:pimeloyl-ACP methyl ester carboxylesterase
MNHSTTAEMEKPIRLKVGDETLFGMLHRPSETARLKHPAGVVFFNAGVRYRIGPYRQYVRIARRLCKAGFYVLRLDSPGIGYSGGELRDFEEYRRHVMDNIDFNRRVVDIFKSETGIERVALCGLCGGACHALLSGARDKRVNFLLLLGLPLEPLGDVSREALSNILLRHYLKKTLKWRSWVRLFSFRSNYDSMRAAFGGLKNFRPQNITLDESLLQAFERCNGDGKSILLIYGANDPFYLSFVADFGERFSDLRRQKRDLEMFLVEGANHLFSKLSWQDLVAEKIAAWLSQRSE